MINLLDFLSRDFEKDDQIYNIDFLILNKGRFEFKEGRLKKLDFFSKLFYSKNKFNEIKNDLQNFTRSITINDKTSDKEKEAIKKLFFETLPKLDSKRKFYLRDISPTVLEFLKSQLHEVQQANQHNPVPLDENPALESVSKTAAVWAKMGSLVKSTSGSSTSYRIVEGGGEGKTLGIFKASVEEPLGSKNTKVAQRIKAIVLRCLPKSLVGSLFETAAGQGYVAEVVQKKVADRVIKILENLRNDLEFEQHQAIIDQMIQGLVPNTEIVNFSIGDQEEKVGSFQEWVDEEHQDAYKFFDLKNKNYQKKFFGNAASEQALPQEYFDMLVIIDYVTGNSDRHGENWFVLTDNADPVNRVKGIRLIDGGWSMAPQPPQSKRAIELGNQYKWKNLPHANNQFSPLGQQVIQGLYQESIYIQQDIQNLYDSQPEEMFPKETNEKRVLAMVERLHVLNQLREGPIKTLAEIRTHAEIGTISGIPSG